MKGHNVGGYLQQLTSIGTENSKIMVRRGIIDCTPSV